MAREIVVNVESRETRIAVVESGKLVELHLEREARVVGNIYKGRVENVLPGMDAAFVNIGLDRNAFLYVGDILPEGMDDASPSRRSLREQKITDVAKSGQEILVQVVKGPRGTKGARVSTRLSLPGRYVVLMPDSDSLGVSRKIDDGAERDRLKRIGDMLKPNGAGLIIRTEAEGQSEEELRSDVGMLARLHQTIQDKTRRARAPSLIHQDLGLLLKTIRDVFGSDVERLVIDSASDYEKVLGILDDVSPGLKDRVQLYQSPEPIFRHFGLDEQVDSLLRRKVWLRSGGSISIDTTEALTAVDVNTGRFTGSTSLSDTIVKTNLDAVEEIARQLRLRDIGGMIVLDFIDMSAAKDRQAVSHALDRALKRDRARTKVAHISPLGLVEMTRKRTGETVTDVMTEQCPYCGGRGRLISAETIAIEIEREVREKAGLRPDDAFLIEAQPEVAADVIGAEGENVERMEREMGRPLYIRARPEMHWEKWEVVPANLWELEEQYLPFRPGQIVHCRVSQSDFIAAPRALAWVDGYMLDVANGHRFRGQRVRVRLTDVRRSFAFGEVLADDASD